MRKAPSHILYLLIVIVFLTGSVLFFNTKSPGKVSATAATTIYFAPSSSLLTPIHKNGGDPVNLNIMLDPGNNYVSIVKMKISYDPSAFKGNADNVLQLDKTVFPSIIDGPLINVNNGTIQVTLSVGPNPNLAIKKITKIGTLNLSTVQDNVASSTLIQFGPETSAFSVAPADQAFENVLVNAVPAYLTVGLGNSLTPGQSPNPTVILSPTNSPTPTRTPTPTIIPTITPTPGKNDTVLYMNVGLHGIGSIGDSVNIKGNLSNKQPIHAAPRFKLSLYSSTGALVQQSLGLLVYDKIAGTYKGGINLGTSVKSGSYIIKAVSQNYLVKRIPGIININPASKFSIATFNMITGDINADNIINVLDYNLLMNCYSDISPISGSCTKTASVNPDLNDDNFVNFKDYNLFVREVSVQHGD